MNSYSHILIYSYSAHKECARKKQEQLTEHGEICADKGDKPFVLLLDMAELIPGSVQLCLQALNANYCLQQVLVKISILLLQRPEHRGIMGDEVTA